MPTSKPSQLRARHSNIPDLHLKQTGLAVLLDVHVDGEMCVDISHLVLESLGDTDDQVVDERSDCAEGGDVLSGTVVQFDLDDILLGMREVDRQVVEVLGELACTIPVRITFASTPCTLLRTSGSFDGDKSRFDGDLD